MKLSKAFDNLIHNLLLTKLKAYGLDNRSVEFFLSYICSRYQRYETNNSYSQWKKVLAGAPQGYMLRHHFYYNFFNDIFLFL